MGSSQVPLSTNSCEKDPVTVFATGLLATVDGKKARHPERKRATSLNSTLHPSALKDAPHFQEWTILSRAPGTKFFPGLVR